MNDDPDQDKTDTPRSDHGGLSAALQRATGHTQGQEAVSKALEEPQVKAPYTGHSHATEAMIAAQQLLLRERLGDLDARIADLNDEREDVKLALDTMDAARTQMKERQGRRRR